MLVTALAIFGTAWEPPIPFDALAGAKAALIPFPREAAWGTPDWVPNRRTRIVYLANQPLTSGKSASHLQRVFAKHGYEFATVPTTNLAAERNAVRITIRPGTVAKPEGYTLNVDADGATIVGTDAAGAYYGVRTFEQMIRSNQGRLAVQHAKVRDWPAFAWRGFMHDTGRNFQTIEELKRQIDLAAAFKVNLFHWHLTDNPAWRVESARFPILGDPKFRKEGRNPEASYTFEQIREVIRYAADRHMRVLPELDMPGHSAYFRTAFGFPMHDPRGVKILESLLEEFCAEIPREDAPWLHIGSDEVHIPDPSGFMKAIGDKVRSLGRVPVIWNPGLPNDGSMIEQSWADEGGVKPLATANAGRLDSSMGYANSYDPLQLVQRYFFGQPCRVPVGDEKALGSILCVWPDVRVDDKRNIERHNGVWPGMLAMAEGAWVGRPSRDPLLATRLPDPATAAGRSFAEFERRMARIRDAFFPGTPFPYARHAQTPWRLTGLNGETVWTHGGSIMLSDPDASQGHLHVGKAVGVATAETVILSREDRTIRAWVGFEVAARSNRRSGGVPPLGQWDPFGADVRVNGIRVEPPKWQKPGANQHLRPTWDQPPNEVPFTDEEFFWTREPATIRLRAGKNRVRLRVPCGYPGQNWGFTFVPVRQNAEGRWVEDESVRWGDPKKDF